jgi:hypothetical protein
MSSAGIRGAMLSALQDYGGGAHKSFRAGWRQGKARQVIHTKQRRKEHTTSSLQHAPKLLNDSLNQHTGAAPKLIPGLASSGHKHGVHDLQPPKQHTNTMHTPHGKMCDFR